VRSCYDRYRHASFKVSLDKASGLSRMFISGSPAPGGALAGKLLSHGAMEC
jgi:hypothetical protein